MGQPGPSQAFVSALLTASRRPAGQWAPDAGGRGNLFSRPPRLQVLAGNSPRGCQQSFLDVGGSQISGVHLKNSDDTQSIHKYLLGAYYIPASPGAGRAGGFCSTGCEFEAQGLSLLLGRTSFPSRSLAA